MVLGEVILACYMHTCVRAGHNLLTKKTTAQLQLQQEEHRASQHQCRDKRQQARHCHIVYWYMAITVYNSNV